MPEFVNDFYINNKQAFLYDPSGKCMLGYFKEKGTEIYDNMRPDCAVFERPARDNRLHQYKDNLQYELVAGINLDFNTGISNLHIMDMILLMKLLKPRDKRKQKQSRNIMTH